MLFRQLYDAASSTYTYLLADPVARKAVLVDPVFENHARDAALLRELGLDLVYTVDTHAHADHVTGAWLMKQALGSRSVLSQRYCASGIDLEVDHGDAIQFGDYALSVRATPGHTNGCLSFVTPGEDIVFTGDCLLIRGAGRTDFQAGDPRTMYRSIHEQIFTLPDDCWVYPAHDYNGRTVSTVREEKLFNARIGAQAREEDFVGFMLNLHLPHPNKIDIAVPANMRGGEPDDPDFELRPANWGPVTLNYAGIPTIDVDWVYIHRDAIHVLDVRTQAEFEEFGHIRDAQLIPLDELRDRVGEIPRDRPIIAVCHMGARSGQATVILNKAGIAKRANLSGGMARWKSLGLPMK